MLSSSGPSGNPNPSIKPIETRYRGYRFRSRLEARWAVFFDHLGMPWRYEVEGYALESGTYLPDFVINPSNANPAMFAEVKGDLENFDGWDKLHELSIQTRQAILILSDIPERAFIGRGNHAPAALFPIVGGPGLSCAYFGLDHTVFPLAIVGGKVPYARCWAYLPVESAFEAARSARFEHGETPTTDWMFSGERSLTDKEAETWQAPVGKYEDEQADLE